METTSTDIITENEKKLLAELSKLANETNEPSRKHDPNSLTVLLDLHKSKIISILDSIAENPKDEREILHILSYFAGKTFFPFFTKELIDFLEKIWDFILESNYIKVLIPSTLFNHICGIDNESDKKLIFNYLERYSDKCKVNITYYAQSIEQFKYIESQYPRAKIGELLTVSIDGSTVLKKILKNKNNIELSTYVLSLLDDKISLLDPANTSPIILLLYLYLEQNELETGKQEVEKTYGINLLEYGNRIVEYPDIKAGLPLKYKLSLDFHPFLLVFFENRKNINKWNSLFLGDQQNLIQRIIREIGSEECKQYYQKISISDPNCITPLHLFILNPSMHKYVKKKDIAQFLKSGWHLKDHKLYGIFPLLYLLLKAYLKAENNPDHRDFLKEILNCFNNKDLKLTAEQLDARCEDNLNATALMFAAACGQEFFVKKLIDLGAKKDLKNNDGETALDLAIHTPSIFSLFDIESQKKSLEKSNPTYSTFYLKLFLYFDTNEQIRNLVSNRIKELPKIDDLDIIKGFFLYYMSKSFNIKYAFIYQNIIEALTKNRSKTIGLLTDTATIIKYHNSSDLDKIIPTLYGKTINFILALYCHYLKDVEKNKDLISSIEIFFESPLLLLELLFVEHADSDEDNKRSTKYAIEHFLKTHPKIIGTMEEKYKTELKKIISAKYLIDLSLDPENKIEYAYQAHHKNEDALTLLMENNLDNDLLATASSKPELIKKCTKKGDVARRILKSNSPHILIKFFQEEFTFRDLLKDDLFLAIKNLTKDEPPKDPKEKKLLEKFLISVIENNTKSLLFIDKINLYICAENIIAFYIKAIEEKKQDIINIIENYYEPKTLEKAFVFCPDTKHEFRFFYLKLFIEMRKVNLAKSYINWLIYPETKSNKPTLSDEEKDFLSILLISMHNLSYTLLLLDDERKDYSLILKAHCSIFQKQYISMLADKKKTLLRIITTYSNKIEKDIAIVLAKDAIMFDETECFIKLLSKGIIPELSLEEKRYLLKKIIPKLALESHLNENIIHFVMSNFRFIDEDQRILFSKQLYIQCKGLLDRIKLKHPKTTFSNDDNKNSILKQFCLEEIQTAENILTKHLLHEPEHKPILEIKKTKGKSKEITAAKLPAPPPSCTAFNHFDFFEAQKLFQITWNCLNKYEKEPVFFNFIFSHFPREIAEKIILFEHAKNSNEFFKDREIILYGHFMTLILLFNLGEKKQEESKTDYDMTVYVPNLETNHDEAQRDSDAFIQKFDPNAKKLNSKQKHFLNYKMGPIDLTLRSELLEIVNTYTCITQSIKHRGVFNVFKNDYESFLSKTFSVANDYAAFFQRKNEIYFREIFHIVKTMVYALLDDFINDRTINDFLLFISGLDPKTYDHYRNVFFDNLYRVINLLIERDPDNREKYQKLITHFPVVGENRITQYINFKPQSIQAPTLPEPGKRKGLEIVAPPK